MYVFLDSLCNVACIYSKIWYVCIHYTIRCIADLFICVAIYNCVCVYLIYIYIYMYIVFCIFSIYILLNQIVVSVY